MRHARVTTSLWFAAFAAVGCFHSIVAQALDATRMVTQYHLTAWRQTEGLPWTYIWAITQSDQGDLWLGTNGGLFRFDGSHFAAWRAEDGSKMPGTIVTALAAGPDGAVWAGDNSGTIGRIDGGRLDIVSDATPAPLGVINALLIDADGTLWAGSTGGLARRVGDRWQQFGTQHGLPGTVVVSLHRDRSGELWVGTLHGVARAAVKAAGDVQFERVSDDAVGAIVQLRDGSVWSTGRAGRPRRVAGAVTSVDAALSSQDARTLLEDRDGNLWMGVADGGLVRWHGNTPQGAQRLGRSDGLPNAAITTMFEDRDGNVWIGTQNGLVRLRDTAAVAFGLAEGLPSERIQALDVGADGRVWVATSAGLAVWDGARWSRRPLPGQGIVITALTHDADGRVLLSTTTGVYRLGSSGYERLTTGGPAELRQPLAIAAAHDGSVWVSDAERGLMHLLGNAAVQVDPLPTRDPRDLPITLAIDRAGRLWVGYQSGRLVVFDGHAWQRVNAAAQDGAAAVLGIHEDNQRRLWVATGRGVAIAELAQTGAWSYRLVAGAGALPDARALAVTSDARGAIWVATPQGLAAFDPAALLETRASSAPRASAVLQIRDGLRAAPLRLSQLLSARAPNGGLWFMTAEGVVRINPGQLGLPRRPPMVRVESLLVDRSVHALQQGPAATSASATLDPGPERVRFGFSAVELSTPERLIYRYQLEGHDRDWITGPYPQATYTRLPPGEYRFRVQAALDPDGFGPSEATVDVRVRPAWYETWLFRLAAVLMATGALAATVVTLYRQRVRAAERQAQRLRALTDAIPQQIWSLRADGSADYFNARWLDYTGLDLAAAVGGGWTDVVHPDDRGRLLSQRTDLLRSGGVYEAEIRLRAKGAGSEPVDGYRWFLTRAVPVYDRRGRIERWYGTNTDVEDAKRATAERDRLQAQLRQSQRLEAVGTLAGGIAHDFKNLLGAIVGYGEMAARASDGASDTHRYVTGVLNASRRAKSLVDRILAFTRGGDGAVRSVHAAQALEEVAELTRASLPADVTLVLDVGADELADAGVAGDPAQLHQILMNLAANAVQAMPKGGRLLLNAAVVVRDAPLRLHTGTLRTGRHVAFTVTDTGTGMSADVLSRAFDPFFTTKAKGVGTGLGLSLVHSIARELGGLVDVSSVPGQGSSFTVYLPWVSATRGQEHSAPPLPRGNGQTVMIVDDERSLLRLTEEMVAGLNYEALGYDSSRAALAAFESAPSRFDAVVTDEAMPGAAGSTMVERMRRLRPDLPVIVVSGSDAQALHEWARRVGGVEVLHKPLSLTDLARSLHLALMG